MAVAAMRLLTMPKTEEQLVGRDVFGRLRGVAAGELSAGNVLEADDRESEEQVEEAGNSSEV
jgi:hypothetical protein